MNEDELPPAPPPKAGSSRDASSYTNGRVTGSPKQQQTPAFMNGKAGGGPSDGHLLALPSAYGARQKVSMKREGTAVSGSPRLGSLPVAVTGSPRFDSSRFLDPRDSAESTPGTSPSIASSEWHSAGSSVADSTYTEPTSHTPSSSSAVALALATAAAVPARQPSPASVAYQSTSHGSNPINGSEASYASQTPSNRERSPVIIQEDWSTSKPSVLSRGRPKTPEPFFDDALEEPPPTARQATFNLITGRTPKAREDAIARRERVPDLERYDLLGTHKNRPSVSTTASSQSESTSSSFRFGSSLPPSTSRSSNLTETSSASRASSESYATSRRPNDPYLLKRISEPPKIDLDFGAASFDLDSMFSFSDSSDILKTPTALSEGFQPHIAKASPTRGVQRKEPPRLEDIPRREDEQRYAAPGTVHTPASTDDYAPRTSTSNIALHRSRSTSSSVALNRGTESHDSTPEASIKRRRRSFGSLLSLSSASSDRQRPAESARIKKSPSADLLPRAASQLSLADSLDRSSRASAISREPDDDERAPSRRSIGGIFRTRNKSLPPTPSSHSPIPPEESRSSAFKRQFSKLKLRSSDAGITQRPRQPSETPSAESKKGLVSRFPKFSRSRDNLNQIFAEVDRAEPSPVPVPSSKPVPTAGPDDTSTPKATGAWKGLLRRKNSIPGLKNPRKSEPTTALGMSLHQANRSEDMLRSFARDDGGQEQERPRERRSLDLLSSDRRKMPRSRSTDNLLDFSVSKLGISMKKPAAKPASAPTVSVPSATWEDTARQHPLAPATPTSTVSTSSASAEASPDKTTFPIATRVSRSDSLSAGHALQTTTVQPAVVPISEVDAVQPTATRTAAAHVRKRVKATDSGVGSDSTLSTSWINIENALDTYLLALQRDDPERGTIVSQDLLPFLKKENEVPPPRPDSLLAKRQRQILFSWAANLTRELREMQPAHRGPCLEAVAAIAECQLMSESALAEDPASQTRYRSTVVDILAFAIEKLNDKAVFANTLVFSGRILALAFFRIEGVALKLLRALPAVRRPVLRRILDEAGIDEQHLPPAQHDLFPSHLRQLCLTNLREYNNLVLPIGPEPPTEDANILVQDGHVVVEMAGNWLVRWTANDSDLPFAFYRAYHRELASYLVKGQSLDQLRESQALSPDRVIVAPGFLFLAASLLDKTDGLIHRNIRSVTSLAPNSNGNFNTNDSANLSFTQKPKVLEVANRRLVSTFLDIAGGPPPGPEADDPLPLDTAMRRYAYGRILPLWLKAAVKRTSMWDTRSVFILLDFIEGLVYTLSYPPPSSKVAPEDVVVPRPDESCLDMFDVDFVFSFVKTILLEADNTVALMRTTAFLYAHFEIFTLRPRDREELCERVILDETVFNRLYLHWNAGVRGYFIRLLVWRLARLGAIEAEMNPDHRQDPKIVAIFGLMNVRLEAIRKRHDELEPPLDPEDEAQLFNPKRSTICSTTGVKEAPFAVDDLYPEVAEDSESDLDHRSTRASFENTARPVKSGNNVAGVSKVVSWIKGGLGRKGSAANGKAQVPDSQVDPFILSRLSESSESTQEISMPPERDAVAEARASLEAPRQDVESGPRSASPAFFAFDFEGGAIPNAGEAAPQEAPVIRRRTLDVHGAGSPRVSARFSKRASILPPAALDVLKHAGEAVPPIPEKYRQQGYDKRLHPYAIRGLRDYEDALDEWTDWVARLQEEEDEGRRPSRGFVDTVPRLQVAWPNSFEDGP